MSTETFTDWVKVTEYDYNVQLQSKNGKSMLIPKCELMNLIVRLLDINAKSGDWYVD